MAILPQVDPFAEQIAQPEDLGPDINFGNGIEQSAGIPTATLNSAFGLSQSPWEAEEGKRIEAVQNWRSMALSEVERAALEPDDYYKDDDLSFAPDVREARKLATNDLFLKAQTDGQQVPTRGPEREFLRNKIAMEVFDGVGGDSEESFNGQIVQAATQRKQKNELLDSLKESAWKGSIIAAAEPGKDNPNSWEAFYEEAKNKPGFNPADATELRIAWYENQQVLKEKIEPFQDELAQVWGAMKKGGAGTLSEVLKEVPGASGDEGKSVIDEAGKKDAAATAFSIYSSLPEESRADFMTALGMLSKTFPKEEQAGFFANLAKQGGRDVDALGRNALEAGINSALKAGMGSMPLTTVGPAGNLQGMTAEQNANVRKNYQAARNFASDVRRIEQQDFAAMKSAWGDDKPGTVEGGLYGVPGALASSVMAAASAPMIYLSMEGAAYDDMRSQLKASGLSDAQASEFADDWAPVSAIPQAILEKFQAEAILGKLPFAEKAISRITDSIKNRVARYATRTAVGAIEETAIERAQDMINPAVQDIASALGQDVPGVNWRNGKDGVLDGFWTQSAQTLVTMLPLSIIGAAGGVSQEQRVKAFADASDAQMLALGATPEKVANFRTESAKGYTSGNRAIEEMMAELDPTSETAKAASEVIAAQETAKVEAAKALTDSGAFPVIRQNSEGWTVTDRATGTTYGPVPTSADAMKLATANFNAIQTASADQVAFLGSMLEGVEQTSKLDGGKTETELDLGTQMTQAMMAATSPEAASRLFKQAQLSEQAEGDTAPGMVKVVFGVSQTDFQQRQRQTLNRLFQGSSIGTVFHEAWHGYRAEAKATGRITRQDEIEFVTALDQLFKQSKNKRGLSLGLIPEGVTPDQITDVMLDEAISQIAEAEILRTRKGGKNREGEGRQNVQNLPSGFITRNIKALAAKGFKAAKKFSAMFEAVRQYFGLAMGRAVLMRKAERDGTLNKKNYDAFVSKLIGLTEQDSFEADASKVAQEITGDPSFSIGNQQQAEQQDVAYLKAVEAGDLETAQAMVDEAAKAAGYDSGPLWHGGRASGIEVFDPSKGDRLPWSGDGNVTYLSASKEVAEGMGDSVYRLFAKLENPRRLREGDYSYTNISESRRISLIKQGYDGILGTPDTPKGQAEIVVFSPSQLKSADPVTYDESGKVIPLSERFNPEDNRISHSIGQEIIDPLISNAANKVKNPKAKERIFQEVISRLQKLNALVANRGVAFNFDAFGKPFEGKFSDEKTETLNALAILDGILAAVPPDLRGRVGGYTQLAKLDTNEKRLDYLKRRLTTVNRVIDDWLKKEYGKQFDKLLERAEVDRKGGEKAKGSLGADGHRFFDQVAAVSKMSEAEVDAELARIDKEIEATDPSDTESLADLAEQFQIVNMFGNFSDKSVADMATAVEMASKVYETKRNIWRMKEEVRLEFVKGLAKATIKDLGDTKNSSVQRAKADSAKLFKAVQGGKWSLKSFAEVLEGVFGENSAITKRWSKAVRQSMQAKTTAIVQAHKRWKKAIEAATGKTGRAARRQVWEMSNKQTITATANPVTTQTIKVPIDTFFDAENQKSLGLSADEITQLTAQFEKLPEKSRKKYLTLEREVQGESDTAKYTESEAIYLSMLWSQDGYKDAMRKHGMGEEFQAQLEEGMSDAAKDLRAYLATEYAGNYEPLRELYASMFGVDLRQTQNYTPGKFYSTGEDSAMDVTGSGFVEGGLKGNFLLGRKKHSAEAKAENAFSVYFNHLNQTEHWKAMAEISREMHGVLGKPEVKKALAAKDPDIAYVMNEWLKALDGNGFNNPKMSWLMDQILSSQAYLAMAWKLSTVVKNGVGATINAAYRMPTKDYAVGMSRLMAGKVDFKKVWDSELIQNRLGGGFSPEVRSAISSAFGSAPTLRGDALLKGMEVIGIADAYGTAIGAAITYDFHYRNAKNSGLSESEAERIGLDQAAETIARTAQPVEVSDRSLMELRLTGIGKIAFVFASEARQKSSLWLTAWANTLTGKPTKKDLRVLLISHVVMAPIMHAVGAMIRDARDPEDDEWFDDKYWNPKDFAVAMATGPLAGIPLIRDVFDGYNGESGPLKRIVDSLAAIKDLFSKEPTGDEVDWYERKVTKLLQGLGPSVAVGSSVFDQIYDLIKNATSD